MKTRYENIYTLFIEGKFEEALAEKKSADSVYGKNYWTPQLLYIQSVYFIKQRMDEEAKTTLQQIINLYPSSPLTPKAQNMLDVLGRRKEIEEYLVKLKVERPKEDSLGNIIDSQPVNNQPGIPVTRGDEKPTVVAPATDSIRNTIPQKDSVQQKPPVISKKDTVTAKPVVPIKSSFAADNNAPHYVVIILEKVDPVYIGEARNAFNRYNKQTYYNKPIEVVNQPLNDTTTLVLMSPFENAAAALDYMEKTRKIASTEIVPWMPAGKLNFVVISGANLELLKSTNDLPEYRRFIRLAYPGKFDQEQPKK
jgi:tetratricopeptide (TPR) repeat protein